MGRFGAHEHDFDALVTRAAEAHKLGGWGVPEFAALILAHIAAESNPPFNWRSFRQEPSGNASIGLMQVLRSNAPGLTDEQMFEPSRNIDLGAGIIAGNWRRSNGDLDAAISAYNGGWRQSVAMGYRATVPVTVCLARDPQGRCVKTRNVAVGEFGNQPYVDKVHSYFEYFLRNPIVTPPGTLPGGTSMPTQLPVTVKPAVAEEPPDEGSHQVSKPLVTGLLIVLGGLLWARYT